jgi:hypothetical protein
MKPGHLHLAFALVASLTFHAAAVTRYVDLNSPSPTPPYTNWLTAATNIQDAIDAADAGDTVVVTNGVYATGGKAVYGTMTNRVVVDKALKLLSVNGPDETIIKGNQTGTNKVGGTAIRCVLLTNGATLVGFTLMEGATKDTGDALYERSGGGLAGFPYFGSSAYASNCIIIGNYADYGGGGVANAILDRCLLTSNVLVRYRGGGGGAYSSELTNCVLVGNTANYTNFGAGGGASDSTLNGCVVIGNSAVGGGGASGCTLVNCTIAGNSALVRGGGVGAGVVVQNSIVHYNVAPTNSDYATPVTFLNSSTSPLSSGNGNIANAPLFVDAVAGDFRLQSNSPCINAGNNAYVTGATDLDGNPRLAGGTVDMGAYEFQSPSSVLSYAWAQQYGLPTDGSADFTDDDGDGANHWQEWRSDTIPTNAASALLMGTATNGVTGLVVSWASVATRSYWLERGADLGGPTPFQPIATNIVGVAGTQTFNDISATNGGPYFYRVGVH